MKYSNLWIGAGGMLVIFGFVVWEFAQVRNQTEKPLPSNLTSINTNRQNELTNPVAVTPKVNTPTNTQPPPDSSPALAVPIENFFNRITKKSFGTYITPKTSPIQPEKFTGFHTGVDAEITPAEASIEIPISSVAAGTVVFAGRVNGYGGVIIIRHLIEGEKLLSLYGHLRIASFAIKVGSEVVPGQKIAVLGSGYTTETDDERKHLHFGLIRGDTITYRGYVKTESELAGWIDPLTLFTGIKP